MTESTHNAEPLVTIVIPTFNSGSKLRRALDSVSYQTSTRWECIIVDDGSSDETLEIAGLYAERPQFRLIPKKSAVKGANVCRNTGLEHARSELVMFLDADDFLLRYCVQDRLKVVAANPGKDFYVFCTAVLLRGEFKYRMFWNHPTLAAGLLATLSGGSPWQTVTPLWNKSYLERIGGWNENYLRLQDLELTIRALLSSPKAHFVDTKADSIFHYPTFNPQKIHNALWSYTRLLRDYSPLVRSSVHFKFSEEQILGSFFRFSQSMLSLRLNRDLEWEKEFLQTLELVGFPTEVVEKFRSDIEAKFS